MERTCAWMFDETALNFCVEGGHALIAEGDFTAYQDVEDDAIASNVDLCTGVDFGVEKFGCGKVE